MLTNSKRIGNYSDGELKYRVIDLMLDKEYVESGTHISVETKIILLGQL